MSIDGKSINPKFNTGLEENLSDFHFSEKGRANPTGIAQLGKALVRSARPMKSMARVKSIRPQKLTLKSTWRDKGPRS